MTGGHRHPEFPSERDLATLADGSIDPARRAEVELAIASSPALQAELHAQRVALDAVRSVAGVRAPATLRASVDAAQRRSPRRARSRPARAFALAGATAVAAVAVVLAVGGAGGEAPTVADAAVLGARPPVARVAEGPDGATSLAGPQAAGLRFPYWADRFGWEPAGARRDRIDGRGATTVFYRRRGARIAYTIVDGKPLHVGGRSRSSLREGVALHNLSAHGRRVVTWLRDGHTCVLSGAPRVGDKTLLRLAAWRGGGALKY